MNEQTLVSKIQQLFTEAALEAQENGYTVIVNVTKDEEHVQTLLNGSDDDLLINMSVLQEVVNKKIVIPKAIGVLEKILEKANEASKETCSCPNCSPEKYTTEELEQYEKDKQKHDQELDDFFKKIFGGPVNE